MFRHTSRDHLGNQDGGQHAIQRLALEMPIHGMIGKLSGDRDRQFFRVPDTHE